MTHISFCGYWKATDDLVCNILQKCSNLQILSLAGNNYSCLFLIIFLKPYYILGCIKITDSVLHSTKNNVQLVEIDLTCCFSIIFYFYFLFYIVIYINIYLL